MIPPGDMLRMIPKRKIPTLEFGTVRLVALIEGVVYCVDVICVKLCNLELRGKSKLK